MPSPAAAANAAPHPLISDQRLQHLYVTLLACRMLRQKQRVKQRKAAPLAMEAIVTGTVTHLEKGDALMPLPGDPLGAFARGHSLRKVLSGTALPGMLPAAAKAEARFAIATGFALAHQQQKHITLALSGPGITSLDALAPSLAFAAANKLGILFVIETPADLDVSGPRHTHALGLPGIPVDGNDVVAIYRVAQEAATRARRGGGPTLIDCKPWPLDGAADPVKKLEQALKRRGLLYPSSREKAKARLSSASA